MTTWWAFERQWLRALLEATAPDVPGQRGLHLDAVPDFLPELTRVAPPLLALGLRATTWLLIWLPLAWPRLHRPFFALDPDRRDAFLTAVAASDAFVLRQLAETLKIIAAFALCADDRARSDLGVST